LIGPGQPDAGFELITCRLQIDEIRRASRYPRLQLILQGHRVGALLNHLQRTNIIELLPSRIQVDDPDDAFLLALSEAGQADILVTGDRLQPVGRQIFRRPFLLSVPRLSIPPPLKSADPRPSGFGGAADKKWAEPCGLTDRTLAHWGHP